MSSCVKATAPGLPIVSPGNAAQLGASRRGEHVNFALYCPGARSVTLAIGAEGKKDALASMPLTGSLHRTGEVWHAAVTPVPWGFWYTYTVVDGFGRNWPDLLDPYASGVDGRNEWGLKAGGDSRRGTIDFEPFDWGEVPRPRLPWRDTVIYEVQVRGFTRHPSANVHQPGTFAGLCQKLPYLKALGVTAIELLPVFDFEEDEGARIDPVTGEKLLNIWGYHPLSFLALKNGFSGGANARDTAGEFKAFVRECHKLELEVILDVVFNHTGEAEPGRPTVSWRGFAERSYYLTNSGDGLTDAGGGLTDTGDRRQSANGRYLDFTGCGNTVNANNPATADLILASLRHWVSEYQVDGFRFDLASVFCRAADGSVDDKPQLITRMVCDPVLADTKLIAEPWDATGFYQVGSFPGAGRFAQWNDRFRDDLRRFVRGDPGFASAVAARLMGSRDLFSRPGDNMWQSVNFVTAHDGFTLRDVVSYSHKHNMRNGEQGRDGSDANHSFNCAEEGPSSDPGINAERDRRVRNLLVLTVLANGTPMLLAGDEFGRTQRGNNNAYCQDNELSWVDWTALESDAGGSLHRFVAMLLAFRRNHPELRRKHFDNDIDSLITRWHGVALDAPDWAHHSHTLAMESDAGNVRSHLIANAFDGPLEFALPPPFSGGWRQVINTARLSPNDMASMLNAEVVATGPGATLQVQRHSIVLLVSSETKTP
jgi:isoamylase